jgi:hypothetical protein
MYLSVTVWLHLNEHWFEKVASSIVEVCGLALGDASTLIRAIG